MIISVDGEKGELDIPFTSPKEHSKGIGYAAWCEVEKLHPEVKIWETVTPYFEKRNIHLRKEYFEITKNLVNTVFARFSYATGIFSYESGRFKLAAIRNIRKSTTVLK